MGTVGRRMPSQGEPNRLGFPGTALVGSLPEFIILRNGPIGNPPVPDAFDTLTAARRLKKVGMEESHAEAVAESLRDAVTGSVATKRDLDAAKAELREEITAVKAETRSLKWLMVFLVGLVLVLVGQLFAILWRRGPLRPPPCRFPRPGCTCGSEGASQ